MNIAATQSAEAATTVDAAAAAAEQEILRSEDDRRLAFLEANARARRRLQNGLAREEQKREKLRQEFGSAAARLFQDWREAQEQENGEAPAPAAGDVSGGERGPVKEAQEQVKTDA